MGSGCDAPTTCWMVCAHLVLSVDVTRQLALIQGTGDGWIACLLSGEYTISIPQRTIENVRKGEAVALLWTTAHRKRSILKRENSTC